MPMNAKRVMVVGSPRAWPHTWAFCDFAKRVKSGMFSESVAQKPTIAVSCGTKTRQNSPGVLNFEPCEKSSRTEPSFHVAHQSRASPATIRNGAAHDSSHLIESIPCHTKCRFTAQN